MGIELNLSGDDLEVMEQSVVQNDVVSITKRMLHDWVQSTDGTVNKLITALDNCDLKAYAVSLKNG